MNDIIEQSKVIENEIQDLSAFELMIRLETIPKRMVSMKLAIQTVLCKKYNFSSTDMKKILNRRKGAF